jgi:hypothetical protein
MRLYPNEFRIIEQMREEQSGSAATTGASNSEEGPSDTLSGPNQDGSRDSRSPDENGTRIADAGSPGGNGESRSDISSAPGGDFGRTGPRSVRPKADIPAIAREDGEEAEPTLPELKTEEDIAKLDRPQLINEMVTIQRATRLPNLTDEQRKELDAYFAKLREYLQKLPR